MQYVFTKVDEVDGGRADEHPKLEHQELERQELERPASEHQVRGKCSILYVICAKKVKLSL